MSETHNTNGAGSSVSNLTFAEKLQEKHGISHDHDPTVEDIVDEEDVNHPPPSSRLPLDRDSVEPGPILVPANEPISEKAIGKQRSQEQVSHITSRKAQDNELDTKSEELFPALGSGPKARSSGPSTAWGSKKPTSIVNGSSKGINGHSISSNTTSPRTTTRGTNTVGPAATSDIADKSRTIPQFMPMPGRHVERIQFAPSQLLPREQLRKPVHDIIRDINKRSKAKVEMKLGGSGIVVFEGQGPVDAVRQALKDVAKEVGSKQAVKIPIPASIRPYIIGKQGVTVQGILKRTGAHIQVPRAEESSTPSEDDDGSTIDVTIEGDAVAAEMARQEIETIVNERTSTMNVRLRDIPAEYYPYLAGPHNSNITALQEGRDVSLKIPQYYSWSHQAPPQPSTPASPPKFAPHPTSHIQLSGDRRAVQEVRAEIDRQVEVLRRQICLSQHAIERGRHQFIVGDHGNTLHELLQETGCAVILPPNDNDTELITITGPRDRLEHGIDKVINLATSMQMSSVDIARQYNSGTVDAQSHARALTRYLKQRQAIAQLETLYDSRIVLPAVEDGPTTWEVYAREGKNLIRARSEIINLLNAHPPERVRYFQLDPFFHQYIREQQAKNLRRNYGVHVVVPNEKDSNVPIVLVYEGLGQDADNFKLPRQRPSQSEIADYESALQKAQEHVLSFATSQRPIDTRKIEVPPKLHEKLRRFVFREQQDLPEGNLPIQVTTGNGVNVRGPKDRLDSFLEKIAVFIEEERRDELERGFTTSLEFPQKYANFLIGKRGENINRLREEFDVDIQVNEGKVELKGPRAKAEAAKSRIHAMGKKLEDEATHVIKVEPQYHREMIGAKGGLVNRLQERYNVRIQFPRSNQAASDHDSSADAVSEAGGAKYGRSNQAQDEVIIRGPSKGADGARDELLSLRTYAMDNSHSAIISVAQSQLPSLIGQGGKEMESIREQTGAKINIPNKESANAAGRVELKLLGTQKQVEEAKKLLEPRVKMFDESVTKTLSVEKRFHKALIGAGGSNIRNIVIQAGGSGDSRELARTVRFPRQDSDDLSIRIQGNQEIVDKIVASIEAYVSERENQIIETVEVAPEKHSLLIGTGGETRRVLESRFQISIDIPRQEVQGHARSLINLVGNPENVKKARSHILEMVKEQEGETVDIPNSLHHAISNNGQFFRRLRQDFKVTVDHAGQQPSPKPTAPSRSHINGGSHLPLITDDHDGEDNCFWEVIENVTDKAEEGTIPWILRGSRDNVSNARKALESALEQARHYSSTGYLILPDPKAYRFVVGTGGSQINSIRKQTGCKITVPRDQARGEAIEIVGSKDGVEEAKNIILDVIKNGKTGRSGRRQS